MDFDRFLTAQERIYSQVIAELTNGRKTSHWMWFIFPQVKGLGFSDISLRYAIDTLDDAQAYLQHEILGQRLIECTRLVLDIHSRSAEDVFGYVDALKFRSSMTLFSLCSSAPDLFDAALKKYFEGAADTRTLKILGIDRR